LSITIAGAGIAGSFLTKLIDKDFRVFDDNIRPGCKCAWGLPYSQTMRCLKEVGFEIEDYILCKIEEIIENGVPIPVRNFATIDKPMLIREFWKNLKIERKRYDFREERKNLVVNATGIPAGGAVFRLNSHQEKVEIRGSDEKRAYTYINPRHSGYAWLFPLDEKGKLFHLGAASIKTDPTRLMEELISYYGFEKEAPKCSCRCPLYVSHPETTDILHGNVVAVGGAAGCVHPITGEGIYPSIESARRLADTINNGYPLENYVASMRDLLKKYEGSYRIIYRMMVSPVWAWLSGIGKTFNYIENFEPRPGFGATFRLFLNFASTYLSNPTPKNLEK
jgi:flavin-dependent dehydrogenase